MQPPAQSKGILSRAFGLRFRVPQSSHLHVAITEGQSDLQNPGLGRRFEMASSLGQLPSKSHEPRQFNRAAQSRRSEGITLLAPSLLPERGPRSRKCLCSSCPLCGTANGRRNHLLVERTILMPVQYAHYQSLSLSLPRLRHVTDLSFCISPRYAKSLRSLCPELLALDSKRLRLPDLDREAWALANFSSKLRSCVRV